MLEAELALQTSGGPGFQADSSMSRVSEDHQGGGKGGVGSTRRNLPQKSVRSGT